MAGLLIGGIRYVKARRRGQTLTCWRFACAQVEWLMSLLHAKAAGKACPDAKLTTAQYLELDSLTSADDALRIMKLVDFSSPKNMDQAFCALLTMMLDLALPSGTRHPVFDRVLCFINNELRRTQLLKQTNNAYARLKQDAKAWREEATERRLWDGTLADGVE